MQSLIFLPGLMYLGLHMVGDISGKIGKTDGDTEDTAGAKKDRRRKYLVSDISLRRMDMMKLLMKVSGKELTSSMIIDLGIERLYKDMIDEIERKGGKSCIYEMAKELMHNN